MHSSMPQAAYFRRTGWREFSQLPDGNISTDAARIRTMRTLSPQARRRWQQAFLSTHIFTSLLMDVLITAEPNLAQHRPESPRLCIDRFLPRQLTSNGYHPNATFHRCNTGASPPSSYPPISLIVHFYTHLHQTSNQNARREQRKDRHFDY